MPFATAGAPMNALMVIAVVVVCAAMVLLAWSDWQTVRTRKDQDLGAEIAELSARRVHDDWKRRQS